MSIQKVSDLEGLNVEAYRYTLSTLKEEYAGAGSEAVRESARKRLETWMLNLDESLLEVSYLLSTDNYNFRHYKSMSLRYCELTALLKESLYYNPEFTGDIWCNGPVYMTQGCEISGSLYVNKGVSESDLAGTEIGLSAENVSIYASGELDLTGDNIKVKTKNGSVYTEYTANRDTSNGSTYSRRPQVDFKGSFLKNTGSALPGLLESGYSDDAIPTCGWIKANLLAMLNSGDGDIIVSENWSS